MKSLVWFRSDLRLEDNPALFHACRDSAAGLIAVFLISSNQWRSHDWGARKIAYVLQSLESLGHDLAAIGIPLVIEEAPGFSDAPMALERLLERHRCKALYFNREYEFNEAARDELLESRLRSQGIEVRAFDDQMIVEPGTIRTQKGEPYSVFTPFWRNWSKRLENQPPAPLPRPAPPGTDFRLDFRLPEFAAARSTGSHSDSEWVVGETAAKEQLMTFLASAGSGYHRLRDDPMANGTRSSISTDLPRTGNQRDRRTPHWRLRGNPGLDSSTRLARLLPPSADLLSKGQPG
jgi:deoxyribodipyrimidine photo-lyase